MYKIYVNGFQVDKLSFNNLLVKYLVDHIPVRLAKEIMDLAVGGFVTFGVFEIERVDY